MHRAKQTLSTTLGVGGAQHIHVRYFQNCLTSGLGPGCAPRPPRKPASISWPGRFTPAPSIRAQPGAGQQRACFLLITDGYWEAAFACAAQLAVNACISQGAQPAKRPDVTPGSRVQSPEGSSLPCGQLPRSRALSISQATAQPKPPDTGVCARPIAQVPTEP